MLWKQLAFLSKKISLHLFCQKKSVGFLKKWYAKPHNTTKDVPLDVLWDWNYKGKMAIIEEFKWHCTCHLQTEQTLQGISTDCLQWQGMAGFYQVTTNCFPLLWGNQRADRDPIDFSASMNQKSYPMNNNQKWLYTSLIKTLCSQF